MNQLERGTLLRPLSRQNIKSKILEFDTLKFTMHLSKGIHTAVSRKVVQLKSIKAYATIPKGMMGCGCSLLHRQVHEFSARWKAML